MVDGNGNREHEEFLTTRTAVREKVGFRLDGVRLTTDQPHQATAAAAEKGRRACRVIYLNLFHATTLRHSRRTSILFLCNHDLRLRGTILSKRL